MSLSDAKIKELFEYYSENGFQQPTEKIVNKLNICHKTFFNRYGSKTNSIEIAWQYWQRQCQRRWMELMDLCNHSVEALTMTLYNIRSMSHEEPHFFEFTREHRRYLDRNSFFYSSLQKVLERGKQCFHIQEDLNEESYIRFLLSNLFLIDVEEDRRPDFLRFILLPALTERGMELFLETPFAS